MTPIALLALLGLTLLIPAFTSDADDAVDEPETPVDPDTPDEPDTPVELGPTDPEAPLTPTEPVLQPEPAVAANIINGTPDADTIEAGSFSTEHRKLMETLA